MHTRSNKKKKWKRREERHYDRIKSRQSKSGVCKEGDSVSKKHANSSSFTTDTGEKKSEQHKNLPRLLTRDRLSLKPFRKRKAVDVDAMYWPSIQVPESIKNKVSDGVKKMVKNIRNNVDSQPSCDSKENSRRQQGCDEVILVDQNVTDRPIVSGKPSIAVDKQAVNATADGKRGVAASDRLKSLKEWLDSSAKSRAVAGEDKIENRHRKFYSDLARHFRDSKMLCAGFKSEKKLDTPRNIRARLSSMLQKNRVCGEDIPAASKSLKINSVFLATSDRFNKSSVSKQRGASTLSKREHCGRLIAGTPETTDTRNELPYEAAFGNPTVDDQGIIRKAASSRVLTEPGISTRYFPGAMYVPTERGASTLQMKGEGTGTPDPEDTSHELAAYQTAWEYSLVDVENISSESDKGAVRSRLSMASEGYSERRGILIASTPKPHDTSHDLAPYQTAFEYSAADFEHTSRESHTTRSRWLMASDVHSGRSPVTTFKPSFLQSGNGQSDGKSKARAISDGDFHSAENQDFFKQQSRPRSGLVGSTRDIRSELCPLDHCSYIIDGSDNEGDFTFGISALHTARRRRKLYQLSPDIAGQSKRSQMEYCMPQTSRANFNKVSPFKPFGSPFIL